MSDSDHTDESAKSDQLTDDSHPTADSDNFRAMHPTDDSSSTDGGETMSTSTTTSGSNRNVARYVNYAVLGGLCLLAFIAALQFYLSTSQAINIWVTREYRSLFQAAFNLVIVLLAGTGIAFQLRRLYGE